MITPQATIGEIELELSGLQYWSDKLQVIFQDEDNHPESRAAAKHLKPYVKMLIRIAKNCHEYQTLQSRIEIAERGLAKILEILEDIGAPKVIGKLANLEFKVHWIVPMSKNQGKKEEAIRKITLNINKRVKVIRTSLKVLDLTADPLLRLDGAEGSGLDTPLGKDGNSVNFDSRSFEVESPDKLRSSVSVEGQASGVAELKLPLGEIPGKDSNEYPASVQAQPSHPSAVERVSQEELKLEKFKRRAAEEWRRMHDGQRKLTREMEDKGYRDMGPALDETGMTPMQVFPKEIEMGKVIRTYEGKRKRIESFAQLCSIITEQDPSFRNLRKEMKMRFRRQLSGWAREYPAEAEV